MKKHKIRVALGSIYVFVFCTILAMGALAMSGCSNLPKAPLKSEGTMVWPDNSVTEDGDQIYINKDGEGTAHKVDPVTGEENVKAMGYDKDKAEGAIEGAKKTADKAPAPWGGIAGTAVAFAGSAILGWIVWQNRKKIKALGGKKGETDEEA